MEDITVVFGYSENLERYSNKAFNLLKEYDHKVIGFNPRTDLVGNLPSEFHTLTMYVNRELSTKFMPDNLKLNFKRIIFNPGAENEDLEKACLQKNLEVVHGCTLVMLKTDQY